MNISNIDELINTKKSTLLCVGPMSKIFVDTSIELSNKHYFPLVLIASRRQIDSKRFGGGYVNNWSTEDFAKYVKTKDKKKTIFLARDHGGPYQNDLEIKKKLSLQEAIKSCKHSYKSDILNDFKFIHIDPSLEVFQKLSEKKIVDIILELMEYCWSISKKYKKKIYFEIGTEEQSEYKNNLEGVDYALNKIKIFTEKNKIDFPKFVVIQTGTKVFKNKNIGSFDSLMRIKNQLPIEVQMPLINNLCKKYKIYVKEHNVDYLSESSLSFHPSLEIHAANVAPEFGYIETKTIVEIMKYLNMKKDLNNLINICLKSNKWKKWVGNETDSTSNETKALLCGHYLFAKKEFQIIFDKVNYNCQKNRMNLKKEISKNLEKILLKYLINFRIIR